MVMRGDESTAQEGRINLDGRYRRHVESLDFTTPSTSCLKLKRLSYRTVAMYHREKTCSVCVMGLRKSVLVSVVYLFSRVLQSKLCKIWCMAGTLRALEEYIMVIDRDRGIKTETMNRSDGKKC